MKLNIKVFLTALILALSNGYRSYAQNPDSQQLKVGLIAPLSGAFAIWGQSIQTAIQMVNTESKYPVKLFFHDEKSCAPADTLTGCRRLVSQEKVNIIIASCLTGASAIAPLAQKDN